MSISVKTTAGTKIVFTGKNGSNSDIHYAERFLEAGSIYTVYTINDDDDFDTEVFLTEFPGKPFNIVHFEKLKFTADQMLQIIDEEIDGLQSSISNGAIISDPLAPLQAVREKIISSCM